MRIEIGKKVKPKNAEVKMQKGDKSKMPKQDSHRNPRNGKRKIEKGYSAVLDDVIVFTKVDDHMRNIKA